MHSLSSTFKDSLHNIIDNSGHNNDINNIH